MTQKYESHVHGGECGAGDPGSPGFQPGNTCAKGDGGGSDDHPAIKKGYVKEGETYTDKEGIPRTVFTEPRVGGKDFELHVPIEKRKEFLDETLKFHDDMNARQVKWEKKRAIEKERERKVQEKKLSKYNALPKIDNPKIDPMERSKLTSLKSEIKDGFKEGIHESWASDAVDGLAIHPEAEGMVVRDRKGTLHGIVTYTLDPKVPDVVMHDLASSGKVRGAGKLLFREVAKVAAAQEKGIFLQSLEAPDTIEFYERLKMHPATSGLREHLYRFTPEETKKFGETGVANKVENMNTHVIINLDDGIGGFAMNIITVIKNAESIKAHTQKSEPEQIHGTGTIL